MKPTFLNHEKPLLTVMVQVRDADAAVGRIRNAIPAGAEAFGLQIENLLPSEQNADRVKWILSEMKGKPCYVTNYRGDQNTGKTDDQLAEEMLNIAEWGVTLCDVMGDMFCKHPEELTDDPTAVDKQIKYIEALHAKGVEVLMSSHVMKFTPAERVLEIALEQKRRGADVIKIVTAADTMEQQIENLRINNLLKEKLGAPYLFLSGGECNIHRRLGGILGCCMTLCVLEHDARSTPVQPLLRIAKTVRDDMGFKE